MHQDSQFAPGPTSNIDHCQTRSYGLSQKSSAVCGTPLRRNYHDQFDGGAKWFDLLHPLNIPALIRRFDAHPEPKTKENCMTATCPNCDTTFRGVDRNEDGSP